jgi:hypothetical protein
MYTFPGALQTLDRLLSYESFSKRTLYKLFSFNKRFKKFAGVSPKFYQA